MPLFKLRAKGTVVKTKHNGLRTWKTWEEQTRQVMWLALAIGLLVGIAVSMAVISVTQSWFGWSW
jgi:hypothetical protein